MYGLIPEFALLFPSGIIMILSVLSVTTDLQNMAYFLREGHIGDNG
jgi:hypothetical protein